MTGGDLTQSKSLVRFLGGALAMMAIAAASMSRPPTLQGLDTERWIDAVFSTILPAAMASPQALPDLNDGRSAVSARWRDSIARFAQSDAEAPPQTGGVVFTGSSSISQWNALESQFAAVPVIKRGLGGARMSDCLHHLDRLVLPYRPRLVVVYAGDNDLAEGLAPEAVLNDYTALVQQIHETLPQTRVAFLSIKLSPSREALASLVRRTNALIADYARHDPRLDFIDVYSRMIDGQGHARPELFRSDGLHPNESGYAVWKAAIADHLR